jgi:FKBP-type peptidyl-prolyl cis-trans isomerase 2
VRCEASSAYGDIDPANVAEVPKEQMPTPPPGPPTIGLKLLVYEALS